MLCKFTISFGNHKFYVKSGFQFGLKNFLRWFCVVEPRPIDIKLCKQKDVVYNYEVFINIEFTKQNIYEWKIYNFVNKIASHDNTSFLKNSVILQKNNKCSILFLAFWDFSFLYLYLALNCFKFWKSHPLCTIILLCTIIQGFRVAW